MRITAGKYRNRLILCPPGVIRPAMDRMRESFFSILESKLGSLHGLSFLDCFSGSGLVAIEAASRGAFPIHLVELDRKKRATIEKNLSIVEESYQLFLMDVKRYFSLCKINYDIVYLDPPFPLSGKQKIVALADENAIVKKGGLLIIHYPGEESWPDQIGDLQLIDSRKYGRSRLLFFKNGRQLERELPS